VAQDQALVLAHAASHDRCGLDRGAVARRQAVADGPGDLSERWLLTGGRVALAEESGRHLEAEECVRLEAALRTTFVHRLTVISNDPLVDEDMVYDLSASAEDLAAFSWEFSGINALLLPHSGTELAVLFSTDDYHLVAGTRQFVTDYAGDLKAARGAFVDFVESLRRDATAAAQGDWLHVLDR
jgi:hypothetical protein